MTTDKPASMPGELVTDGRDSLPCRDPRAPAPKPNAYPLLDNALRWIEDDDLIEPGLMSDFVLDNLREARDLLAAQVKQRRGWNITLAEVTFGRWHDRWGASGWRIGRSCRRCCGMWANTPAPSLRWLWREYRRTWRIHRNHCPGPSVWDGTE